MARSTYIYLITENNTPFAAFTVKREMEDYLNSVGVPYRRLIKIYRMKDNPHVSEMPQNITDKYIEDYD